MSPRQTIRSTPSRAISARTASRAGRLPWMSAINARRTKPCGRQRYWVDNPKPSAGRARGDPVPRPQYDCAMPSLLVTGGPLSGHELVVESQLVLGRGDADIVIDDPEISRRHALMSTRDGAIEIEDLGSLNGTWVNEHRIESAVRLAPGDVIRLGQTTMEVKAPRPAATEYEPRAVRRGRRGAGASRVPAVGRPVRRRLDPGWTMSGVRRGGPEPGSVLLVLRRRHHAPSGRTRPPRSPLVPTRSRRPAAPTSCAPSPPCSPTSSARPPSASA